MSKPRPRTAPARSALVDTPSIFDELIDYIETAEQQHEAGHPVEALISLGTARSRLTSFLSEQAN